MLGGSILGWALFLSIAFVSYYLQDKKEGE